MARARTRAYLPSALAFACALGSAAWAAPHDFTGIAGKRADRPLHYYRSKTDRARSGAPRPENLPTLTGNSARAIYYGGRVITNVVVVPVFWTSSVDAAVQSQIPGFLSTLTASSYMDWLEEYDTIGLSGQDGKPGSNQHIGRGTATSPVIITPSNMSTSLADADIAGELAAQLDAGALPAPVTDGKGNVNSLYMIEFPPGFTIDLLGKTNCSSFCGYHETMLYKGLSVPYAVMPDLNDCSGSCGTGFGWVTSIHSHELVEAVTDTEAGLLTGLMLARPLGWYDPADNTELADICDPFSPAPGITGGTATVAGYTVQLVWSNFAGACVAGIPICDGTSGQPSCRPCTAYDDGAACTGGTPFCQTDPTATNAGQCVGCTGDEGCSAPTPLCDPGTSTCRACKPADCSGATPLCGTSGACVQCDGTDYAMCQGATPLCDLSTGTCVACLSGLDCTRGAPVCDPSTHLCRACVSDGDCDGQVCDTTSDATRGQCVACVADRDCTFGTCDVTTHTCAIAPRDAGADAGGERASGGSRYPNPDTGRCDCRAGRSGGGKSGAAAASLAAVMGLFMRRARRRATSRSEVVRGARRGRLAGEASEGTQSAPTPRTRRG